MSHYPGGYPGFALEATQECNQDSSTKHRRSSMLCGGGERPPAHFLVGGASKSHCQRTKERKKHTYFCHQPQVLGQVHIIFCFFFIHPIMEALASTSPESVWSVEVHHWPMEYSIN